MYELYVKMQLVPRREHRPSVFEKNNYCLGFVRDAT